MASCVRLRMCDEDPVLGPLMELLRRVLPAGLSGTIRRGIIHSILGAFLSAVPMYVSMQRTP